MSINRIGCSEEREWPDRTNLSHEVDEEEAFDQNPSGFDPASRARATPEGALLQKLYGHSSFSM